MLDGLTTFSVRPATRALRLADERSWTYMTPEAHPWAGIITFSAYEAEQNVSVAKIHLMVRAMDPLYEISFKLFVSRLEDKMWIHTLTEVANYFGSVAPVECSFSLIDKKRQWNQFGNIWKNSGIRSLLRQDRR